MVAIIVANVYTGAAGTGADVIVATQNCRRRRDRAAGVVVVVAAAAAISAVMPCPCVVGRAGAAAVGVADQGHEAAAAAAAVVISDRLPPADAGYVVGTAAVMDLVAESRRSPFTTVACSTGGRAAARTVLCQFFSVEGCAAVRATPAVAVVSAAAAAAGILVGSDVHAVIPVAATCVCCVGGVCTAPAGTPVTALVARPGAAAGGEVAGFGRSLACCNPECRRVPVTPGACVRGMPAANAVVGRSSAAVRSTPAAAAVAAAAAVVSVASGAHRAAPGRTSAVIAAAADTTATVAVAIVLMMSSVSS